MTGRRSGFTLVELLVVMVLGTLVLGAVYQTLIVQDRTYRHERAVMTSQQTARMALQVLAAELREISPDDGDLLVATTDSIRFRAMRQAAVVCNVDAPGQRFDVWEIGGDIGSGDALLVFVDDDPLRSTDDRWVTMTVSGTDAANMWCPTSWDGGATSQRRITVSASGSVLQDVLPGALVRSWVPVSYFLYSVDGEWMLGRQQDSEPAEELIGPLAAPEDGGLVFTYFDEFGNPLTPTTAAVRDSVRRIQITVRAQSPVGVTGDGPYVDSLMTDVYLRNY